MSESPKIESSASAIESEGSAIADRLEALVGAKKEERVMRNLLLALRTGGKRAATVFLWNESDKFRSAPDVIAFCEKEILESTRRIGSTDKNNILMSIADSKDRARRRGMVAEGAVGNFYASVSKLFERLG